MKEKDIHKLIEQQNPEIKQRIWERICVELDLPTVPQKKPLQRNSVTKGSRTV